MEDPLRCPLDVALSSTDTEPGLHGLKVLLDNNANDAAAPKTLVRAKAVPSIDLFDTKPILASKKTAAVKKFLTPFQRFQVRFFLSKYSNLGFTSFLEMQLKIHTRLSRLSFVLVLSSEAWIISELMLN